MLIWEVLLWSLWTERECKWTLSGNKYEEETTAWNSSGKTQAVPNAMTHPLPPELSAPCICETDREGEDRNKTLAQKGVI